MLPEVRRHITRIYDTRAGVPIVRRAHMTAWQDVGWLTARRALVARLAVGWMG
jgi:hypothetical protein